jgi:hypothetical protein
MLFSILFNEFMFFFFVVNVSDDKTKEFIT